MAASGCRRSGPLVSPRPALELCLPGRRGRRFLSPPEPQVRRQGSDRRGNRQGRGGALPGQVVRDPQRGRIPQQLVEPRAHPAAESRPLHLHCRVDGKLVTYSLWWEKRAATAREKLKVQAAPWISPGTQARPPGAESPPPPTPFSPPAWRAPGAGGGLSRWVSTAARAGGLTGSMSEA